MNDTTKPTGIRFIKDPALEPYYIQLDDYCYAVQEIIIAQESGKEYQNTLGFYTNFSNCLKAIAKDKVKKQQSEVWGVNEEKCIRNLISVVIESNKESQNYIVVDDSEQVPNEENSNSEEVTEQYKSEDSEEEKLKSCLKKKQNSQTKSVSFCDTDSCDLKNTPFDEMFKKFLTEEPQSLSIEAIETIKRIVFFNNPLL